MTGVRITDNGDLIPIAPSRAATPTSKPATSCLNSFPGSTLVLLGNSTTTRIDQVQVGDWVEATDPDTGQTIAEPVTAVIITTTDHDYTDITITTAGGHTATITSTAHHRYYDVAHHRWVDATNLSPGDQLRQPNGDTTTITTMVNHPDTTTTYNLTITGLHTYYGYVATTKFESIALGKPGNVYHLDGVHGVDVNETLGFHPSFGEHEIAIPGRIDPSRIIGVRMRSTGEWISNPNYIPLG